MGVYKPAASGGRWDGSRWRYDDAESLWQAAGQPLTLADVCPQCFPAPLAPPRAAAAAGQSIDDHLLRAGIRPWLAASDLVIVEGVGGLLSPLSDTDLVADLARDLGLPLVIVAPNRLGTINQALETEFVARHYRGGLPLAGVVLNDVASANPLLDPSQASNAADLAARLASGLLAELRWDAADFDRPVDWQALASAGLVL